MRSHWQPCLVHVPVLPPLCQVTRVTYLSVIFLICTVRIISGSRFWGWCSDSLIVMDIPSAVLMVMFLFLGLV